MNNKRLPLQSSEQYPCVMNPMPETNDKCHVGEGHSGIGSIALQTEGSVRLFLADILTVTPSREARRTKRPQTPEDVAAYIDKIETSRLQALAELPFNF